MRRGFGERLVGPVLRLSDEWDEVLYAAWPSSAPRPDGPLSQDFVGGDGPDTLTGTGAADNMEGRGGDDTLYGRAGNDILVGEGGDDRLYGEDGNDILEGGSGNDLLEGGAGFDLATYILSTAGVSVDMTVTGAQNTMGAGVDILVDVEGLYGSDYNDILVGNGAANLLAGLKGADTIRGGAGGDELNGGDGNDTLEGEDGDDLLTGGLGNDVLRGGAGYDAAYFYGGLPLTVDLRISGPQNTGQGLDTLVDIEDVVGTSGADVIHGNDASNVLNGDRGNDRLYGHGGDDILVVATQSHAPGQFDGGAGFDVLMAPESAYLATSTLTDIEALAGKWVTIGGSILKGLQVIDVETLHTVGQDIVDLRGIDILADRLLVDGAGVTLAGSLRDHFIDGSSTANIITGGDAADTIRADMGDDVLDGGLGDDDIEGGDGADTLTGGEGADLMMGGRNDDILWGGAGNDRLMGDHGNDTIHGGDGDDHLGDNEGVNTIYGEAGNDTLYVSFNHSDTVSASTTYDGGEGDDVFLIENGSYGDFLDWHTYDGGDGFDRVEISAGLGDPPVDIGLFDFRNIELIAAQSVRATMAQWNAMRIEAPILTIVDSSGVVDFRNVAYVPGQITLESAATLDLTGRAYTSPWGIGYQLKGSSGDDVIRVGVPGTFVFAGAGNDEIVGGAGSDRLYGEDGNDRLSGGDIISDDRLEGGAGDDYLLGQAGNDELLGGDGNDVMIGGRGFDTAYFEGAFSEFTMDMSGDGTITLSRQGETETVRGVELLSFNGVRHVFFVGDDADDRIEAPNDVTERAYFDGREGNDYFRAAYWGESTAFGGDGDDTLLAGTNLSTVRFDGGSGNDTLTGWTGTDVLAGGSGRDTLNGHQGDDTLTGGLGEDFVDGGAGYDIVVMGGPAGEARIIEDTFNDTWTVRSSDGNDFLRSVDEIRFDDRTIYLAETERRGTGDAETILGTRAIDILRGSDGDDILRGEDGLDRLYGDAGADRLFGGADADVLDGGEGNDTLDGGDGDDLFLISMGNDRLIGGAGVDTVKLPFTRSHYTITNNSDGAIDVKLNPISGFTSFKITLSSVEMLEFSSEKYLLAPHQLGTTAGDTLVGTSESDAIDGGTGADVINGGGGNDVLVGGRGRDTLTGGSGADRFIWSAYQDSGLETPDWITDFEMGVDTIDLTAISQSAVTIEWNEGTSRVYFAVTSAGAIRGMIQVDGLVAVGDIDRANTIFTLLGDSADNRIFGSAGGDMVEGRAGDDHLNGDTGNDTLLGGQGFDLLEGGDGDDILNGGGSNDTLVGGAGYDTAVFSGWSWNYQIKVENYRTIVTGRDGKDVLTSVEYLVFDDGRWEAGKIVCFEPGEDGGVNDAKSGGGMTLPGPADEGFEGPLILPTDVEGLKSAKEMLPAAEPNGTREPIADGQVAEFWAEPELQRLAMNVVWSDLSDQMGRDPHRMSQSAAWIDWMV